MPVSPAEPSDHARAGGADAAQLFPEMYARLHALAEEWFAAEPVDHTLQPTALVHEAYLRLAHQPEARWRDRTHFYAIAARAMRWVLVDHARKRRSAKRGGAWQRISLSESAAGSTSIDVDVLALHEALQKLETLNGTHCRIAELRFLGGLTVEETARALDMAPRTVRLHWRMARAWLLGELRRSELS